MLCNICGRKYVPDVLLAAVELPHEAAVQGPGQLLEVHMCCVLPQERRGVESSAARISELMPFIEYDLHKNITSKLKIRCHKSVFGLWSQLSVSDGLVTHDDRNLNAAGGPPHSTTHHHFARGPGPTSDGVASRPHRLPDTAAGIREQPVEPVSYEDGGGAGVSGGARMRAAAAAGDGGAPKEGGRWIEGARRASRRRETGSEG